MSKTLIVYYSLDGGTKLVADLLHDRTGGDLQQLIPEKEPAGGGLRKLAEGGFTALIHYKPRIKHLRHDPADYDTIVLACPVWAGTTPPAMETFLNKEAFSGKEVVICTSSGSGKGDKTIERIKSLVGDDNRVTVTANFKNPLADPDKTRQKVEEFCLAWAE